MKKETVKIVIVGHVDHGKSTLIGRLLLDTNSLPKEKITEINKISKELGKDTQLAYLADQLKEEREQNITIDTTQIFFQTRKRHYVIIDAPGHLQFIKNMITGASLAEAAVLIVDAQEGIQEQTRRHAYIIRMLGVDKVIVVFNKMDLVGYQRDKFTTLEAELLEFLGDLEIKPVHTIPISAKEATNVSKKSQKINWHAGPTLIEGLDSLKLSSKIAKESLRFPIQDIYELDGEKIIVGRVASGEIRQGQKVSVLPNLQYTTIRAIKVFEKQKTCAREGESIGLTLDDPLELKRGNIIVQQKSPPSPIEKFKGNIFWMSKEPLHIHKPILLRCATQEVECIVEQIEKRLNSSTLQILETNAQALRMNEAGIVILKTHQPIVVDKFSSVEELGRFVIERGYNTEGAGVITELIQ
ncbi:MAG: GTP-binding protein [Candidatus Omnitrophota bacterium]|nr:MAG: GTP-binding protein [Candidatus Omnitrophota bacterium]